MIAGFTFATAFVPLTSQGMTGVREGENGLASGFAHAFAVAAGILAIGAITANRTLPARG